MIKMKKLTKSDKRKMILVAGTALILVLFILLVSAIAKGVKSKKEDKDAGYSFSTSALKDIKNAECLNEEICVFTDSSGKKGLMTLDGTVTEKAGNYEFKVVSDEWLSYKVIAKTPDSDYPLLVDTNTGTIGKKQYNKAENPEKVAYWNAEAAALCWYGADGYIDRVSPADLKPDIKLMPVAASDEPGAKYGYVNSGLNVAIDFSYDRAGQFSEGLAAVSQSGKFGYINETGGIEIPFEYDSAGENPYSFRNGLVPVTKNAKFGILDRRGREVVSFDFDKILQGKDGKYIANKGGKWGILTVNEEIFSAANTTSAPQTDSVENYRVSTSGSTLNLRAEPSVYAQKLTEIPNGTPIIVESIEGEWAKVKYGAYNGYVSANYITQIQ